ncbi:MAG: hypothetical protein Q7U04_06000 [Bacteriovorax sp.]|nr:hypothetical protein [Bacteriovorax sp.]
MENLIATYPSFLKNEPLIWGVSVSDLFRLSFVMVVMQILGASQLVILGATILFYLGLISARSFFPRRYFEFQLKRKKLIKWSVINEKIKSI